MKNSHSAVILAIALFCLGVQVSAQRSRHVVVHAGHLLDVKSGKLLADQTLVIEDGRILSSGGAAEAKIPADATRIELPNATLLPGLIDAHTHLTFDPRFGYDRLAISVPREALIGAKNARVTLLAGFTTVATLERASSPISPCAMPSMPAIFPDLASTPAAQRWVLPADIAMTPC